MNSRAGSSDPLEQMVNGLDRDAPQDGASSQQNGGHARMSQLRYSSRYKKRAAIRLSSNPIQLEGRSTEEIDEAIENGDLLKVKVRSSSKVSDNEISDLRNSLNRFFQTPCEKWTSTRKFPFKLLLQLVKVFIVTWQLATFFGERATFEQFSRTNRVAFHHVFLQDWSADHEVLPYPPGTGDYAMYTQDHLLDHMNYVLYQYYRFEDLTLTSLVPSPNDSAKLDVRYFKKAELRPIQESYEVDAEITNLTISLPESIKDSDCIKKAARENATPESCYQIHEQLKDGNRTIEARRIVDMKMTLMLYGINVKVPEYSLAQPTADVECVIFIVTIKYDNSKRSGQFLVKLTTELDMRVCQKREGSEQNPNIERRNIAGLVGLTVFDCCVMAVCIISLCLALRSVLQRKKKMQQAKGLFKEHYGVELTVPEMMEFMTLWYIQYIISDVLVIAATGIKIYLKHGDVAYQKTFSNEQFFNAAGIMLGLANWSQWIGLIRFLGYFDRYYILILTITNAAPALLRFLVCGGAIFFGYLFAGWIVLGPYNQKFESVYASAQSLFSLINGDEIYATMSIINNDDHPTEIWIVSCIYLYSYIILFIFAIANLFIAVIMDSYETIKSGGGYHKTFLHHFTNGTLVTRDTTESDTQEVMTDLDEDEIDQQYGILRPFLCCLEKCVHHNTNSNSRQENNGDLRLNEMEMNTVESVNV